MKTWSSIVATVLLAGVLGGCAFIRHGGDRAWEATAPEPLPPRPAANGAIFQSGYDLQLFENSVARRIGDILTIHLVESTGATKSASTATKKASTAAIAGPSLLGRAITIGGKQVLAANTDSTTQFDGSGSSKQSNSLDGTLSVTVVQRLDNGNLVVRGEKWITINQGQEFVRLSGIVRPVDIDPDNSIVSSKVANARIAYSGHGAVADATAPGLLARFFNSKWAPL